MAASSLAPDSDAVPASLEHLVCASAGHMFSAAPQSLPLSLAHSILDFADLRSIAVSVAATARGWYANCAAYALLVQANAARDDDSRTSHRLGSRSDDCRLVSADFVPLLCRSRLRSAVLSLVVSRRIVSPSALAALADAIPQLRSLECLIDSSECPARFSPRLECLRIGCVPTPDAFAILPRYPRSAEIATAIAQLHRLQTLQVTAPVNTSWPTGEPWFSRLQSLPRLHTLDCSPGIGGVSVHDFQRHQSRFVKFPALTTLVQPNLDADPKSMAWMLQQMDSTHRIARLPLDQTELSPALSEMLLLFSASLTCLRPKLWMWHEDLSWLRGFTALRQLRFVCPVAEHVDPPQNMIRGFISSLATLQTMENLTIKYAMLTDAHWEAVCTLPRLRYLTVHSKAITTLQPLSWRSHLARTVEALHLRVPAVPAEDARHILTLSSLRFLSVKGSFTGPLQPSALYFLQPPYPKRDSPVHWLRRFVPRSDNEPNLPVALSAGSAVGVFRLYPAVLALVLSWLELKQFCHAASVSREWREAASLPAAWSSSCSPAVPPLSIGSGLVHPSMHRVCTPFVHSSRALIIRNTDPNWGPAFFPRLPLWRHIRALTLLIGDGGGQLINDRNLGPAQGLSARRQAMLEESLASLSHLAQLESFSADWSGFKHTDAVSAMFVTVGPRLLRGHFVNLPVAALAYFTRIQELHLRWKERFVLLDCGCPGAELAALHSLHSVVLQGASWSAQLGSALQSLGDQHSLRAVEMCVEDPCAIPGSNLSRKLRLDQLRAGLVELLVAIHSVALDSLILRLHTPRDFRFPSAAGADFVALRTLLPLAHLRRFELHAQSHRLDSHFVHGLIGPGFPLESLTLSASIRVETLRDLTFFTNLRELRIVEVRKPRSAPKWKIAPPMLKIFAAQIPRLEVLLVDTVQLPSGDLKHLADMSHLRTLVLCLQHFLVPADFEVLSRIPMLSLLHLEMNSMDLEAIVSPDRTLLSVIRDCRSLRLFRWCIERRILNAMALAHDSHQCTWNQSMAGNFQLLAEMSRQRNTLRSLLSDRLRIEIKSFRQQYGPPRSWVPLQPLPAVAAAFPRSVQRHPAKRVWLRDCEASNRFDVVDSLMASFLTSDAAEFAKANEAGRVCCQKYGCLRDSLWLG